MNILVIGKFYAEGFGLHIAETFVRMGHDVRRFEPGVRHRLRSRLALRLIQARGVIHAATDGIPWIRARRMRQLWRVAEERPLDVVIVCHDFLWPGEVAELKRRTGAAVALWFPDSIAGFGRGYFMIAPYDALFFKDPFQVARLGGVVRSPVWYMPECFNPERHFLARPLSEEDLARYRCDICTAGTFHTYRAAFFGHLVDYDVRIWGNPPPLWMPQMVVTTRYGGKFVAYEDKAKAFRAAKIVVNNLLYSEIWGVNARTFEAAGIGAFQMVDWRPGLAQLFRDGDEVISFRNIADLKNKINYWLPREDERLAIGEAGKRKAHSEHTYCMRLELLLDTLAGRERGFPLPHIASVG
jgi:spore maturation protein CgeB